MVDRFSLGDFLEALFTFFFQKGSIQVGSLALPVKEVTVEPLSDFSRRALCKTISPLVVSTGVQKEGKLHKVLLDPQDPRFLTLVWENLWRKAEAFGLQGKEKASFLFSPLGEWHSRLITVQGTQVRGYEGKFLLEGDRDLFLLAYDAGLGE